MPYKGINTYIAEMRQEQIEMTNKYLNLGVPATAIQILQEQVMRDLATVANEQMAQEKEHYEKALEEAKEKEDKQNGTTKEKQ